MTLETDYQRQLHVMDVRDPKSYRMVLDAGQQRFVQQLQYLVPALLGEVNAHYHGPQRFKELVDFGWNVDELRNSVIPTAERWQTNEDLPREVTVLSFQNPRIKEAMHRVTELAQEIAQRKQSNENSDDQVSEYKTLIDEVMDYVQETFQPTDQEYVVTVALLRGGLRFLDRFSADPNHGMKVSVEAKRVDYKDGRMVVGLDNKWQTALNRLHNEYVRGERSEVILEFADDCLASGVSIEAAILALHEKFMAGDFPRIAEVRVHVTVGVQQGIEKLIAFVRDLDQQNPINIRIVAGDLAYQLSDHLYIERAADEVDANGNNYGAHVPTVGDMGDALEAAEKIK